MSEPCCIPRGELGVDLQMNQFADSQKEHPSWGSQSTSGGAGTTVAEPWPWDLHAVGPQVSRLLPPSGLPSH